MDIAALCQREVVTIDERSSIQHAATLMRDRHVGALVVTREEGGSMTLAGVVTDRDLTIVALASGIDADSPVGPIATGTVVAVPQSTSVAAGVTTMREAGVRRLVLVDGDHQLAGIVSLDDLLAAFAEEIHDLAGAVERGIEHEARSDTPAMVAKRQHVAVPQVLSSAWRRVVAP